MFSLLDQSLDANACRQSVQNDAAGAFVSFEGWVRNHNDGRKVLKLEYEAFKPLADKEADKIIAEAKERFAVYDITCLHRVGVLNVGELAVWLGVTAAHRKAAFAACEYVIDEIKSRLPIWKKEHYVDGTSSWVNCQTNCHVSSQSGADDNLAHFGNALDFSTTTISPICGVEPMTENDKATALSFEILPQTKEEFSKYQMVDIREVNETDGRSLVICIDLPLSQMDPAKLDLRKDKQYLFFCAKGMRSNRLVEELRRLGHTNTYSLTGGISTIKDLVSGITT